MKDTKNARLAASRTYLGTAGDDSLDPARDCPSAAQEPPANVPMDARYDMDARYGDERIMLTPGFVSALETLMREEMAMMRVANAAYADCWTWGRCTVWDVSLSNGLAFEFGGDADRPQGLTGDVQVLCLPGQDPAAAAEV